MSVLPADPEGLVTRLDELFEAAKADYPVGSYGGPWEEFETTLSRAWPRIRELLATAPALAPSTPLARQGDLVLTVVGEPCPDPRREFRRRIALIRVAFAARRGGPPDEPA